MKKTFWNGEPCQARRVRVIVADAPEVPRYWARPFVGQVRKAVEVVYGSRTFYLDDEAAEAESHTVTLPGGRQETFESPAGYDGWGWDKVTQGQGSPGLGHRNLRVERVVPDSPPVLRSSRIVPAQAIPTPKSVLKPIPLRDLPYLTKDEFDSCQQKRREEEARSSLDQLLAGKEVTTACNWRDSESAPWEEIVALMNFCAPRQKEAL